MTDTTKMVIHTFTGPEVMFPFAPMTEVLVRDVCNAPWVKDYFLYCTPGAAAPYTVGGKRGDEKYWFGVCIPYKGNEHLEGTCLAKGTPKTPEDCMRIAAPDLLKALDGLLGIVRESRGVCGYHLNGDEALWGEFDEDIDAAYDAIAKAEGRDNG